jgi:hypothetical protein
MSVRFAAALNQPIDAIADRKDRKACASDGTGCAVEIAAAAIADTIAQGQCRCRKQWQRQNRQKSGQSRSGQKPIYVIHLVVTLMVSQIRLH